MTFLTIAASIAAIFGFVYLAVFGSRSMQEWLEERRNRRAAKPRGTDSGLRPPDFKTLREQLRRLRIGAAPDLDNLDEDRLKRLGNPKLIVGNVILDGGFVEFAGIAPDGLRIEWHPRRMPQVPDYVIEARREIEREIKELPKEKREPNHFKVFLDGWQPPIIDRGNLVELIASKSDWWMRQAISANVDRLQADILEGHIALVSFSPPLDTPAVVITADNQLVLAYRGEMVEYQPNTWSIPGEQMDAEKDFSERTKSVSPGMTIKRLLTETDELHLPDHVANSAEIKFIALATEWNMLLANLVAIVNLRQTVSTEVAEYFSKGEQKFVHFVDLPSDPDSCLHSCLPLLYDGATIKIPGRLEKRARLTDIARFSILAALFNKFGYLRMIEEISHRSGC